MTVRIDRRDFLRLSGTGLAGLTLAIRPTAAEEPFVGEMQMNPYVNIAPDGSVSLFAPLADMGQGIFTTLPMIIAEEMDLDWQRVQLKLAPTDNAFGNPARNEQYAAESKSVRGYFDELRRLGAVARHMLVRAAAERWGVQDKDCETTAGEIVHRASGRRLDYGAVAAEAASLPVPERLTLKPVDEFRLLGGKAPPRRDVAPKSLGREQYGIDVRRPGMRYAAVRHVPVLGAKIVGFSIPVSAGIDADQAFLLDEGTLVAVAGNTWAAQRAVDAVEWQLEYPDTVPDELAASPVERARTRLGERGLPAIGQTVEAADDTAWDLEREYSVPLLAHAPLEPLACVAEWDGARMEVWASVQGPPRALKAIIQALELPRESVTVHQVSMGGSFGRRAQVDFTVQAARIARRIGGAVKLTWSRREEIQQDYFRPAYAARIEAKLDTRGQPSRIRARVAGESTLTRLGYRMPPGAADVTTVNHLFQDGYAIEALERRFIRSPQPVRVGFWRSVASSMNAFFSETFINEIAQARAVDPIDYRVALLAGDARARGVLERVRDMTGWGNANDGLFRGVAFCMPYDSYLAQVVEIEMLSDGKYRLRGIHTAVDCGLALDPVNVRSQIEGATIFGLTAAAYGEITLRDGEVAQQNFDTYRMARLAQTPVMQTLVVDSEEPPGGAGELGVPAVAPALAAALQAATGRWPRDLPLTRSGFSLV